MNRYHPRNVIIECTSPIFSHNVFFRVDALENALQTRMVIGLFSWAVIGLSPLRTGSLARVLSPVK
jgi:hypothetical protein